MIKPVTLVGNASLVARTPSSVLSSPAPSIRIPMPSSSGQVARIGFTGAIMARKPPRLIRGPWRMRSARAPVLRAADSCRSESAPRHDCGQAIAVVSGARIVERARRMTHQQQPEPADLRLGQRSRHHGICSPARVEGQPVIRKAQHDRVREHLQGDAHVGFAAVVRTVLDDVRDDLLEYELGVVARRSLESLDIERRMQSREAFSEACVSAGKTDLDVRRWHGAIRPRNRRVQPCTAAAAAVASERTGTTWFSEVVSKTCATSGWAPYSTSLPPFRPRARAIVMNMRMPPEPMNVTWDRSIMTLAPRGTRCAVRGVSMWSTPGVSSRPTSERLSTPLTSRPSCNCM